MKGARAPRPGHIKGTPFQCGPLLEKRADCGAMARFGGGNQQRLRELNKRIKIFQGEDGWFGDGTLGQVWEYGKGRLGFTVGSGIMIEVAIREGFTATQRGDGEANFACDWTPQSVEWLIGLLRLKTRRRDYPSHPMKGNESARPTPS